jgi:hypothetical protein
VTKLNKSDLNVIGDLQSVVRKNNLVVIPALLPPACREGGGGRVKEDAEGGREQEARVNMI